MTGKDDSASQGAGAEGLRRYLVRGGGLALGGRAVTLVLSLGVNGLVTRLLSPTDAGSYFLLLSVVSVFATLAQLGLPRAAVLLLGRAKVQEPESVDSLIKGVSGLSLASGAVLALLLAAGPGRWILRRLGAPEVGGLLVAIVALWILGKTSSEVSSEIFRGLRKIGHAVATGPALAQAFLLMALAALWIGFGSSPGSGHGSRSLELVVVAAAGSAVAAAGVALALLAWRRRPPAIRSPAASWAGLVAESWPFLGSALLVILWEAVGYWLLGASGTEPSDLALYGTALRTSQFVSLPLLVANAVLPPVIAELAAVSDRRRLTAILRLASGVTTWIAIGVLVSFLVGGEYVLQTIFGAFYGQGLVILLLLALSHGVVVATGSTGMVLLMAGHQRIHLVVNACCLGLLLLLGAEMVDRHGAVGLAAAVLIARSLQQAAFLILVRRRVGVWTHAELSPRRLFHLSRRLAHRGGETQAGQSQP